MVFADEIYDRLVMDGLEHTSIAALADDVPMVTLNDFPNPTACVDTDVDG